MTVRHVSARPLRRVGRSAPVTPCRHQRPVGSWAGASPRVWPAAQAVLPRPGAGPGPEGGLAQNLHKVGPAAGRHRRGRRLSYRRGGAGGAACTGRVHGLSATDKAANGEPTCKDWKEK